MHFGEYVRKKRDSAGVTQGELARMAGISNVSLSYLENGHTTARRATAERLCKALGAKADELDAAMALAGFASSNLIGKAVKLLSKI